MTVDLAADSLAKASTPEPLGTKSLWNTPGLQLPAYIQHIARDLIEKRGMDKSRAIATAIAAIKRWAAGGGKVDAGTRAAAEKALAEWEAAKARAHATPNLSRTDPNGVLDMAMPPALAKAIAAKNGTKTAPVVSSSDGPRVVKTAGGKPPGKGGPDGTKRSPMAEKLYQKLLKKGMKPPQAHAMAVRGASTRKVKNMTAAPGTVVELSYPITSRAALRRAVLAASRVDSPDAVRAHLTGQARKLGAADLLPAEWGKS